jgi:hypothetical protein
VILPLIPAKSAENLAVKMGRKKNENFWKKN